MIAGTVGLGLAVICGFLALAPPHRTIADRTALIRISTLSPAEWRQYQQARGSPYQRWARPALLLWAHRLHLRPARVDQRLLEEAGLDATRFTRIDLQALRLSGAGLGLIAGAGLGLMVPGSTLLVPLLAWAGYVVPVGVIQRRRRRRQGRIRRELPDLIGIVRAFHRAGVPLERTLHLLAGQRASFPVLGAEIEGAMARYGLGLSLEQALEGVAQRTGLPEVYLVVGTLVQGRRLGSGLDDGLKDHEVAARAAQRNQATAEASRVSTKLLAILAAIYLPEFVLLIMIPLFLGLLQHAFA